MPDELPPEVPAPTRKLLKHRSHLFAAHSCAQGLRPIKDSHFEVHVVVDADWCATIGRGQVRCRIRLCNNLSFLTEVVEHAFAGVTFTELMRRYDVSGEIWANKGPNELMIESAINHALMDGASVHFSLGCLGQVVTIDDVVRYGRSLTELRMSVQFTPEAEPQVFIFPRQDDGTDLLSNYFVWGT